MALGSTRRWLATALLIAVPGSFAESVAGVLRDGVVHHESATAAATHHAAGGYGHHGHEDPGAAPQGHRHDGSHQHGTATDHCTHVHGIALTIAFDVVLPNPDAEEAYTEPAIRIRFTSRDDFRPPRV